MRVVVAHDYCTQRGGAERVTLALLRTFPGAPLCTTLWNPEKTYSEFEDHAPKTSWLQSVPIVRTDPRYALPLLPAAVRSMAIPSADVVVCSSSGWAHGVRTSAPKVVYCHNPPRWLYQPEDYERGLPRSQRSLIRALRPLLERWDQAMAREAVVYIANSTTVARRIASIYGRTAEVVHPPIALEEGPEKAVAGVEPNFLLSVARGRGYKHVDVVVSALDELQEERLVVVGGDPTAFTHPRVTCLDEVSDEELRWLYRNAKALVSVAHEDFGLTPIEANAFGTPAVVLRAGGFLDSIEEGVNGLFIEKAIAGEVAASIRRLSPNLRGDTVASVARRFSLERFAERIASIAATAVADRTRSRSAG